MADPAVRRALDVAKANEPATLADQVRLCEVAAPPFQERARAEVYASMFRAVGLSNVRLDSVGNVIGERPGRSARPHLVLSAHLDTVFPEGTDVRVTIDGDVLRGPGIADDCRGLAVLLAVARALDAGRLETPGSITFVGTVGEEGLGNLRGVRMLLQESLRDPVDRFVSLDGGGHSTTHIGVGSRRYRVTFRGQGGHSYQSFGIANPVHALGRAIALLSDVHVPEQPRTTFNVGRVGGGTSINAIAAEAWMEVDLRSADGQALQALDGRVRDTVQEAVELENQRWERPGTLSVTIEDIGSRPGGRTRVDDAVVERAVSVTRALGLTTVLQEGSTDANVPMSLGIPAITVGSGGVGANTHSLQESFDASDSWQGTQRMLLLALALSEP